MTKRRKQVAAIVIALLVSAVLLTAVWAGKDRMKRFYRYAPYANAIVYCHDKLGGIPASLGHLEDVYNASDVCAVEIPVPGHPPPHFRPIRGLDPDHLYLVIIEPKPTTPIRLNRLLIYATPEGARTRTEFVWEWEVKDRIGEDDRLRLRSATTRSSDH